MFKSIFSKISNVIPACAIVAFVAMILACTTTQSAVDSSGGGANDSGSDGAMLTDSISTSATFDEIASL